MLKIIKKCLSKLPTIVIVDIILLIILIITIIVKR